MTGEYEVLQNPGLQVVNGDLLQGADVEMTLLVLGAPRGGTSALAGALAELGLYMGKGAKPPVYEGLVLARAMESGQREEAAREIADYNAQHRVWAYKRPGFTHFVSEYHALFRNPVYLVISRDPVATASRGMISGRLKGNYLKKLQQILAKYQGIIDFVETHGACAVFISYEKLLQDPAGLLANLVGTLGLRVDETAMQAAIRFVEPSPRHYLEVSRAERTEGEWQRFDARCIAGWARFVNKSMNRPPQVILYQGEREIARTSADRPGGGQPGNLDCGFSFDLQELGLLPSPALRLRVKGEIRDMPRPAYSGANRLLFHWRALATRRRNS
ncbi:sulfotransferase [Haliea sp. E17]|uniref:sulfotransferase n=1 Tax=Haliea sp. E17 TaxID=3401576 RepID=UPI003AABD2CB